MSFKFAMFLIVLFVSILFVFLIGGERGLTEQQSNDRFFRIVGNALRITAPIAAILIVFAVYLIFRQSH